MVQHGRIYSAFGADRKATVKGNSNNGSFAQSPAVTIGDSTIKDNGNAGMSARGAHVDVFGSVFGWAINLGQQSWLRQANRRAAIEAAARCAIGSGKARTSPFLCRSRSRSFPGAVERRRIRRISG